jgi:outer membrane protein insertion porin family
MSGSVNLHDYNVNYTISSLGTLRTEGTSLRLGIPAFRDYYTRLYVQYGLDLQSFTGASSDQAFAATFSCNNCWSSVVTATILHDTRIDAPFPTGGSLHEIDLSQGGGPLQGAGDYQKIDMQSLWYAPLGGIGSDPRKQTIKFVMSLAGKAGFVFGSEPFFNQLFAMGGTQYGIPLPGYYEFSITPYGYDPNAQNGVANPNAFGKAYMSLTAEVSATVAQAFKVSLFSDEGNVWVHAADFNPADLLRGFGIGFSVMSPLGPIGVDLAYGFDRVDQFGNPMPGWKADVQLGNTTLGSPFSSVFGQY